MDGFFKGSARAGKLIPISHPRLHNLEVLHNLSYAKSGERHHLLDIYRPRKASGPRPVVLYFHGGGFRILSKDTHWVFGLLYARRGYLVVNVNYRLAPKHIYPAAHQDAFAAYRWVLENVARYGGDPDQIVVAGESAGANLATALAVATSYRRPEPWARPLYDLNVQPRAVVSGCGLLQVSDPERFSRGRPISTFIQDRMDEVTRAYLPDTGEKDHGLADPLCILETGKPPQRPLPPFFAFSGTWDPVMPDTERLAAALESLGVRHRVQFYPRGVHGFHAFAFDSTARRCWRDTFAFLDTALEKSPEPATRLFVGR